MMGLESIGIIGAGGWLGQAFSQAIVEAGIVPAESLTLSFRTQQPSLLPAARWTRDNQELVDRSDVIIVSIRPEDFSFIEATTSGKLVVSVMAGITVDQLVRRFQTDRVARTLPNGAVEVRKSYTPWIASGGMTEADAKFVQQILESCGDADQVSNEADIDYLTGLTGSGPAFPALLAAAMMKDAVECGIDPAVARRAVKAVLVGTGRLVELWDRCPNDIVETFLNYRGTTAAAIETMLDAAFNEVVSKGLGAALRKSISMGQASARNL